MVNIYIYSPLGRYSTFVFAGARVRSTLTRFRPAFPTGPSNRWSCLLFNPHRRLGIMTHHVGFTLLFEQALQVIDPSVSIPYWEYTIECERGQAMGWERSVVPVAAVRRHVHPLTDGNGRRQNFPDFFFYLRHATWF